MTDSPYIVVATQANFAELVARSHDVPVLIDFWASWCQPCQVLMPLLSKLAEEYAGGFLLAKLNTEEEQQLAAQFGIRSIPTVKLYRHGEAVDEFMGALPESEIRAFLDRHVARASDPQIDQALQRLAEGDADTADTLLTQAAAADPDNPRLPVAQARLAMVRGDFATALQQLDGLPLNRQDDAAVIALRSELDVARTLAGAPDANTLMARLEQDPNDHEARLQLATHHVAAERFEAALELLLELLRRDRNYEDQAARKGMVRIFERLGDDPLAARYRSKMASLLY